MPDRAYIYTPNVALNESGIQEYTGDGTIESQGGGGTYETNYVIDDETGDRVYDFDETDYSMDGDAVPDIDDEYIQNIHDAYPDLGNAQMYASRNWSADQLESFNEVMENGELDQVMPRLEDLVNEYRNSGEEHEPQTFDDDEEIELPDEEQIFEAFDEGKESEPAGLEHAMEWLQMAEQTSESDPVYSSVCQLSAAFHNGELSAEDCWSQALETHNLADLVRVYRHLQQ